MFGTHHCWNVQLSCRNRCGNQVEGSIFWRVLSFFSRGWWGLKPKFICPGFVFFSSASPVSSDVFYRWIILLSSCHKEFVVDLELFCEAQRSKVQLRTIKFFESKCLRLQCCSSCLFEGFRRLGEKLGLFLGKQSWQGVHCPRWSEVNKLVQHIWCLLQLRSAPSFF